MDGGDIVVSGEFDRGEKWMYKGKEEGSGHYRLERRDPGIEGGRQRSIDSRAQVFWTAAWNERIEVDGKQLTLVGMWRIHLGKPDDVQIARQVRFDREASRSPGRRRGST